MQNINSKRVFKRNDHQLDDEGDFVLYWMQTNHRLQYNYALEYAAGWANKLGKPLLIYEELKCDYRWASERIHTFYLEGMAEHANIANQQNLNYLPDVEQEPGESRHLQNQLFDRACCLITDEFPVFFIRERNRALGDNLEIPVITVDSNGLIPLGLTKKAPYNAYFFRKIMQKNFVECFTAPPKQHPLKDVENKSAIALPNEPKKIRKKSLEILDDPKAFLSALDIRHDVKPVRKKGTRRAALDRLRNFIQHGLSQYDEHRNDPDESAVSGLSPWLHFGKISAHEIVKTVLDHQPKNWDLDDISYNGGSTGGFFNGDANVDSFLDQVVTWREVGFHFAHHESKYDQFESLPGWARKTLTKHAGDKRDWIYKFDELAQSKTHDELWNAAQTQLREEGIMHNYLRMLWGKKVMEWTPDPETAIDYLIELNNLYAIDGRDPNSYSGIFWCFGRFDRAWQERPIFGKTRYMTSSSARKKLKLDQYLDKYGNQKKTDR